MTSSRPASERACFFLFSGFCELLDPNYGAATTGQEKWQCVEKGGRRPKRRRPHAALVFSQRRAPHSENKEGEEELFIRRRAETATVAEETRPMDVMIHDPDSDSLKLEAATGRRREEQGKKRVDYDHGNDRRGTPGAMGTEADPGLFFRNSGATSRVKLRLSHVIMRVCVCDKKIVPWIERRRGEDGFQFGGGGQSEWSRRRFPFSPIAPRRKLSRSRRRRRGKREAPPRRREGRRKSPQICTVTTADVEGGEPQTPVNPEKEYMEKGAGNLSCFPLLPPCFPEIIKASK